MAPTSLKRKLLGVAFKSRKREAAKKRTPRKKTRTKKGTSSSRKKRNVKPAAVVTPVSSQPNSPVAAAAASTIGSSNTTAPLKPKVEYSPNTMAKCQSCRKKIQKNHKRYGIPEYSDRYSKEIYRYYHLRCCPTSLKTQVPNAEAELSRQMQVAQDNVRIVDIERRDLFEKLKRLRLLFANRLEVPFFMVFNNKVLNELVVKMPTTSTGLLNIHGIGPTKSKSFGDPILTVIRQYKQQQEGDHASSFTAGTRSATTTGTPHIKVSIKSEQTRNHSTTRRRKSAEAKDVICIDVDDDSSKDGNEDDGDIMIGDTVSCEQLVAQKFAHAAKNGYVISID